MAKCGDQTIGINLHLSAHDFSFPPNDVPSPRFANSDDIGRSPFIFELMAAEWNGLCAFLKVFDKPIGEGVVEIIFFNLD